MNRSQLLKKIQETEQQLNKLKEELSFCKEVTIQEASVGDVLEDGSIVLIKEKNHAIVVCSKDREFHSNWYDLEKNKIAAGFGPDWFIPSKELLCLAYKTIPEHFNSIFYWCSTETNSSFACNVDFNGGYQGNGSKSYTDCVRSVRCIVF